MFMDVEGVSIVLEKWIFHRVSKFKTLGDEERPFQHALGLVFEL